MQWNLPKRYLAAGIILGAGSPLGLFILRMVGTLDDGLRNWMISEWTAMGAVYAYSGVATAAILGALGYVFGMRTEQLSRLAVIDGLTQLYVHNYILQRLDEERRRALRYHEPLACLFIDIDRFKSLNSRYGHPFGDQVLKKIAQAIRHHVRISDVVGRYGGDEFLVILPEADQQRAYEVAERVRTAVQELKLQAGGEEVMISISIGIFVGMNLPVDSKELIEQADLALRHAKDAGRNRSVLYSARN